jgi:hypothetical protein
VGRPSLVQMLAVRPPPWAVRLPGLAPILHRLLHHLRPPPRAVPMTSAAPHATPLTQPVLRAGPMSMTTAAPLVAPELYPLHYSHCPRDAQEPPTLPLHQQSPPVKAVPVAPPVNPHPMTTRANRGFRLTDSPCRPPRCQPCRWYLPPFTSPSPIRTGIVP